MNFDKRSDRQGIFHDSGMRHQYIECSCGSGDHNIRITYFVNRNGNIDLDSDFPELYFETTLDTYHPWYKRIVIAFKYIFKRYNKKGHYVETLLDVPEAVKMGEILNKFIEDSNQYMIERKTNK